MAKPPEEMELEQAWIGAEDLPIHFVNAFVGVTGPNAVFLTLGSQLPPSISSEADVEALMARGYLEVKPVARFALAPEGLDEMIEALKNLRSTHRKLTKALKGDES
jgi:hypothetical protein